MTVLEEIPVGPDARVYAEGWQSWSPTTWYGRGDRPYRPAEGWQHVMRFRPDRDESAPGVHGEGLLVVEPGAGAPARVFATLDASRDVPTIRAVQADDRIVVETDDPHAVTSWTHDGGGEAALEDFGDRFGAAAGARLGLAAPRVWCTWYRYFEEVTASDVIENLRAIERVGLDVDVVQIDDGWSLGLGEWMAPHPRFGSLADTVAAIRDGGRRAGIWTAPFSVGASSSVAREHPEWLVGDAGFNWGDGMRGLDLTHPGVRDYLTRVFTELRELGIDYVKLDFLYSGAIAGTRHDADVTAIEVYRSGLKLIRSVLGDDTFMLGCGAPILPSVGIVDAMRVSPDTFHEGGEDGSQGLRGRMSLQARSWQHGRFWTTDPDCLVARPEFALREEWAEVVLASPGLRGFSDRIDELDPRGLELVRSLLEGVRA